MKPMGHLARSFGTVTLLALVVLLGFGDASRPQDAVTVAFVGACPAGSDPTFRRFHNSLSRLSAETAQNIRIDYYEGGDLDHSRLSRTISSAAATRPRVLVVPTGDSALIAAAIKERPPVVFASHPDPLKLGIVDSLRFPGRHITGVSLADTLHLKRLELLKDAFPELRKVGLLADASWIANELTPELVESARSLFGLDVTVHIANTAEELARVMHTTTAAQAQAWYVPASYIAYAAESEIISQMQRLKRPAIHTTEGEVKAGALMAYSQDTDFALDAIAALTLRVAAGEDAGSIPIERPRRYRLSLRVAEGQAWAEISPALLRRADRVYREAPTRTPMAKPCDDPTP